MSRLLPDILLPGRDFGLAELCAARLDGELVAVDGAFAPVDLPETMAVRLSAVAALLPPRAIIERQSALWVYGCRPFPPRRHQASVRTGCGSRPQGTARLAIREVALRELDVVIEYGVPVTSMVRTAIDVARSQVRLDEVERAQLRHLLTRSGATLAECLEVLGRGRSLPHTVRATRHLTELYAAGPAPFARGSTAADPVHVVHRVDAPHGVQNAVEVGRVAHLEDEPADREAVA